MPRWIDKEPNDEGRIAISVMLNKDMLLKMHDLVINKGYVRNLMIEKAVNKVFFGEEIELKSELKPEKRYKGIRYTMRPLALTRLIVVNDIGIPIRANPYIEGNNIIIVKVSLGGPDETSMKEDYFSIEKLKREPKTMTQIQGIR